MALMFAIWVVSGSLGCSTTNSAKADAADTRVKTDADSDGDSDADSDSDGDTDSDGDSDADSDSDGDTDSDGDSDADSDSDGDSDSDSATDDESGGDSNTGVAAGSDSDTETDAAWSSESGDTDSATVTSAEQTDSDTRSDESDSSANDTGVLDTETFADTHFEICETVTASLTRLPPRVVFLLDRSGSMNGDNKWGQANIAIDTIVREYEDRIDFGIDFFPSVSVTTGSNNGRIEMDVAPRNAERLLARLNEIAADGGSTPLFLNMKQFAIHYTDYSGTTVVPVEPLPVGGTCPYVCADDCGLVGGVPVTGDCAAHGGQCCNLYTSAESRDAEDKPIYEIMTPPEGAVTPQKYAPVFLNSQGASYLIVISDGAANNGLAYSAPWSEPDDNAPNFAALTSILYKQKGIQTIAVGFGDSFDETELNAIAQSGGTPFSEFLLASNGEDLSEALDAISQMVSVGCEFTIGSFDRDDVDYDKVILSFDDETIPRNLNHCDSGVGWSWKSGERTDMQLCKDTCTVLATGNVETVTVHLACSDDEVVVLE